MYAGKLKEDKYENFKVFHLETKNGNNDTMCRVALEAAKEKGAEIEFIHLLDWDIQYCSGCVACSRAL